MSCSSRTRPGDHFKVYLPAHEAQAPASPQERPPTDQMLGGPRPSSWWMTREALREVGFHSLTEMGYGVLTASSGEEALDIYRLPGRRDRSWWSWTWACPAWAAIAASRRCWPSTPQAKVVIASGYSAKDQVKTTLESGAQGFVAKPFRLLDLLTTVRSVLDEG